MRPESKQPQHSPYPVGGSASGDRRAAPAALSMEASGWQQVPVGVAATLQVIVMALTLVSGLLLWVGWPGCRRGPSPVRLSSRRATATNTGGEATHGRDHH